MGKPKIFHPIEAWESPGIQRRCVSVVKLGSLIHLCYWKKVLFGEGVFVGRAARA